MEFAQALGVFVGSARSFIPAQPSRDQAYRTCSSSELPPANPRVGGADTVTLAEDLGGFGELPS